MQSTDHVFELIRSMSRSEKRYFRLEASKCGGEEGSEYLHLYDAIESQSRYDEAALRRQFGNETWIKRLPGIKNYLYNALLQSISNYHAERNSATVLHRLLQQIDVLFGKGLYKQAHKLLKKAKKTALEYQRLPYLLIILEWEQKFSDLEENFDKLQRQLQGLLQEEEDCLKRLRHKLDIEWLHHKVICEMYTQGTPRTEEAKLRYKDFLDDPVLQRDYSESDWYTQNGYYSAVSMCQYMLGDKEASLQTIFKRIGMFERNPHILIEDNVDYSVAMYNCIQILSNQGRYSEAFEALDKVRHFIQSPHLVTDERAREFFFLILYYHPTRLGLMLGDLGQIKTLDSELRKRYKELSEKPNKNRLFFMIPLNMTAGHFILGDYDKALYWARIVLNDRKNTIRSDILGFIRILHLLIQYEIQNYSILEYYIGSTQRYLQENDKLLEFEHLLLGFVKKLLALPDFGKNAPDLYLKTKSELQALAQRDHYTEHLLINYHLDCWFDSKTGAGSLEKLVREKTRVLREKEKKEETNSKF